MTLLSLADRETIRVLFAVPLVLLQTRVGGVVADDADDSQLAQLAERLDQDQVAHLQVSARGTLHCRGDILGLATKPAKDTKAKCGLDGCI